MIFRDLCNCDFALPPKARHPIQERTRKAHIITWLTLQHSFLVKNHDLYKGGLAHAPQDSVYSFSF